MVKEIIGSDHSSNKNRKPIAQIGLNLYIPITLVMRRELLKQSVIYSVQVDALFTSSSKTIENMISKQRENLTGDQYKDMNKNLESGQISNPFRTLTSQQQQGAAMYG
jgi:hypothetical protein